MFEGMKLSGVTLKLLVMFRHKESKFHCGSFSVKIGLGVCVCGFGVLLMKVISGSRLTVI